MMKTLRLLIDLEYDDLAMHADDVDAKEWFISRNPFFMRSVFLFNRRQLSRGGTGEGKMKEKITMEDKRNYVALDGVTLNGKPAVIRGWANSFATVANLHNGVSYEYAWATVRDVVETRNKAFKS